MQLFSFLSHDRPFINLALMGQAFRQKEGIDYPLFFSEHPEIVEFAPFASKASGFAALLA